MRKAFKERGQLSLVLKDHLGLAGKTRDNEVFPVLGVHRGRAPGEGGLLCVVKSVQALLEERREGGWSQAIGGLLCGANETGLGRQNASDNEGNDLIQAVDIGRTFAPEKCEREGANSLFHRTSMSPRKVAMGLVWEHAGQAGPCSEPFLRARRVRGAGREGGLSTAPSSAGPRGSSALSASILLVPGRYSRSSGFVSRRGPDQVSTVEPQTCMPAATTTPLTRAGLWPLICPCC